MPERWQLIRQMSAVRIDSVDYVLAYNIRAMILFEKIADKPFEIKTLTDWAILAYACILSANLDFSFGFDEFVDKIEQPELEKAIGFISKRMNVNNHLSENKPSKKK